MRDVGPAGCQQRRKLHPAADFRQNATAKAGRGGLGRTVRRGVKLTGRGRERVKRTRIEHKPWQRDAVTAER